MFAKKKTSDWLERHWLSASWHWGGNEVRECHAKQRRAPRDQLTLPRCVTKHPPHSIPRFVQQLHQKIVEGCYPSSRPVDLAQLQNLARRTPTWNYFKRSASVKKNELSNHPSCRSPLVVTIVKFSQGPWRHNTKESYTKSITEYRLTRLQASTVASQSTWLFPTGLWWHIHASGDVSAHWSTVVMSRPFCSTFRNSTEWLHLRTGSSCGMNEKKSNFIIVCPSSVRALWFKHWWRSICE